MRRVKGHTGVPLLECTNPVKGKWRVRWDVQGHDDGTADYMEMEFSHKPSEEEIRETITAYINGQTDAAILRGFAWKGQAVYLSTENQLNFASIERNGRISYPLTVKVNETEQGESEYATFERKEDFTAFSQAASLYIIETVQNGWRRKDGLKMEDYRMDS